jgi:hypothetical protein
MLPRAHLVV